MRTKHRTEILFKSRRMGCSFCFLYHRMSCKHPLKIVCTHKYKTLQWSNFTVESACCCCCFLLLPPSRISTWLQIQRWVFMLRMNERRFWDARISCRPRASASFTCCFVVLAVGLSSVAETPSSLHSCAECYLHSSLGHQSLLVCWGFYSPDLPSYSW